MTATFVLEDMTEKQFMRSVNGQSSEHKIDGQVSNTISYMYDEKTESFIFKDFDFLPNNKQVL